MPAPVTILDGGMGQHLKNTGAPFRQPEWSALALIEAPEAVRSGHDAFIAAGADIITTNAYALVPFHIGEARFASDGSRLSELAGRLARAAADSAGGRTVRVAGCLPPVFGSYRPDLFDAERAPHLLSVLVAGQSPFVDLWLGETLGSIAEAEAVCTLLDGDARPAWVAFTLKDHAPDYADPRLRSGEPVAAAVRAAARFGARAVLFNCSQPEVMAGAVDAARNAIAAAGADIPVGIYANAYQPMRADAEANIGDTTIRGELGPSAYLAFARDWISRGAGIVGGCCGIGPAHIAELRRSLG